MSHLRHICILKDVTLVHKTRQRYTRFFWLYHANWHRVNLLSSFASEPESRRRIKTLIKVPASIRIVMQTEEKLRLKSINRELSRCLILSQIEGRWWCGCENRVHWTTYINCLLVRLTCSLIFFQQDIVAWNKEKPANGMLTQIRTWNGFKQRNTSVDL